jgi:RNA polymerase sigma-70 factor (ECF subfamily)
MNEHEIWNSFKDGSEASFFLLYKEYASMMFRYGCKLSKDKDMVKDCLQQVFFNLWKGKENLGNPDSIKNYMLKALRCEIIKQSCKKNSFESLPDNYHFLSLSSYESDLIDLQTNEISQKKVEALLVQLPARQKEVLFLKYYMDLNPKEISVVMGLEQESVYKLTYKAIDKLQQLFFKTYAAFFLLFLRSLY